MNIADYYLIEGYKLINERTLKLHNCYKTLEEGYKKYRRKTIPNNKLKMNGEPMRRKSR